MKYLLGQVITNLTFTSTSWKSLQMQGRDVVLTLKVPKGFSGAAYIKEIASPKYAYQEEVLFKQGLQYCIQSVKLVNGIYYIVGEVVL